MSIQKKLKIKLTHTNYPIFIGSNILKNFNKILKTYCKDSNKILFVSNSTISKKYLKKITNKLNKSIEHSLLNIGSGERNKNLKEVNNILDVLTKKNFNRNDIVVALGGGIVGDVSGFAASIFKRGIFFIQIPTSLLSQVDSSVGGKTGVNNMYGKNLIGTFYQPKFVLIDILTLKTLPRREMISGFAEILKYSLIKNRSFFYWLQKNGKNIINFQSNKVLIKAIFTSCKIKAQIVEKDEKEMGLRALLNFGHTLGHALESHLKYSKKLNHGEAVIIGMLAACKVSQNMGFLKSDELEKVIQIYKKLGLKSSIATYLKSNELSKFLQIMKKDKKNKLNFINLILLKNIGKAFICKSQIKKSFLPILKNEIKNG